MGRRNKSKFAILGLLSTEPMSGYDIKRAAEASIGYFWQEGYSSIYPNLKKLLSEGLVSNKVEAQTPGPDRIVYSLTEKGWEELKAWLMLEPEPEPVRNELLLKLFFGEHLDAKHQIRYLEKARVANEIRLKSLQSIVARLKSELPDQSGLPYWLITLKFGIHTRTALDAWFEETINDLKTVVKGSGSKPFTKFVLKAADGGKNVE
ncbi:MAG: PadR family transcriptional regulator [Acidobacteriota bacterium]|nr:PadR family transcriptional regulator [Acidobacteriota bacterium]MDH3530098.1 PadR family transcriptional regulator [Acidobacteriota bacterium]